ncbi:MAG: nucleotide exchange factor GrpE [Candidatus Cloacimonadia bacterium]
MEKKIEVKDQNSQAQKQAKTKSTKPKLKEEKELDKLRAENNALKKEMQGHKKEIDRLKAENTSLKKEMEVYRDRLLRTAAEFENFRKRTDKERMEWIQSANKELLLDVADIFEQLEMALKSENNENLSENHKKFLDMICEQFNQLFKRYGLEKIETIGKKFDPALHEAVMSIDHDNYEESIICDTLKGGYKINNKVVRPAKVVVSKGKKRNNKNDMKEMNNE